MAMHNMRPLSLYIHIPWCVRKCPYCDFNSHTSEFELPEAEYIDRLLADLLDELPKASGRPVASLFIGGGTPSLFRPEAFARLLNSIRQMIPVEPSAEITMEANPASSEAERFSGYRAAGINRLSIGIQSFNDKSLQILGRAHDRNEALQAADMARSAGFENFNLDLMFGLPEQTLESALDDVNRAMACRPSHLSFYQLTLEPNTWFHRYPPQLPGDEAIWDIQQHCQSALKAGGYEQYEVSAYATPGHQCRHNLNYWQFGDYLGIGAGAHGKITDPATGTVTRNWKIRNPKNYLRASNPMERQGGSEIVRISELPFEFLMNALRLREGFTIDQFENATGLSMQVLEPELSECRQAGLLETHFNRIRCTEFGYNFMDNILQRFLAR